MYKSLNLTRGPVLGGVLALGAVMAAPVVQAEPMGYATNSAASIVRNDFGDCVHTSSWKESLAIEQCEPKLAAANKPKPETDMAAMEPEPKPERVVRRISLSSDTYFDFDKATLTDEGMQRLDEIARKVRGAEDPQIRIIGHTDRIGPEAYNMQLSAQRSEVVKNYLKERGVSASLMQTEAMGEASPVKQCEGMRGTALIDCLAPNRRTDIEFSAFEVVQP